MAKRVPIKKTAMVAPRPARPPMKQLDLLDTQLATILSELGNTRAYTIISRRPDGWLIHFEGDYDHSEVKLKNGKPVIITVK